MIAPKWIAKDGKSFWIVWSDLQRKGTKRTRAVSERVQADEPAGSGAGHATTHAVYSVSTLNGSTSSSRKCPGTHAPESKQRSGQQPRDNPSEWNVLCQHFVRSCWCVSGFILSL
jgi:ABC-type nickel/cobalt efflux system permease component RcnA